jgi:hypothetical protein
VKSRLGQPSNNICGANYDIASPLLHHRRIDSRPLRQRAVKLTTVFTIVAYTACRANLTTAPFLEPSSEMAPPLSAAFRKQWTQYWRQGREPSGIGAPQRSECDKPLDDDERVHLAVCRRKEKVAVTLRRDESPTGRRTIRFVCIEQIVLPRCSYDQPRFHWKNGSVGLHLDGARWLLCEPLGAAMSSV